MVKVVKLQKRTPNSKPYRKTKQNKTKQNKRKVKPKKALRREKKK
jgi:hypothetical protein